MQRVLADMHVSPMWRRWLLRLGLAAVIVVFIAFVPAKFLVESVPAQHLERETEGLRAEIARLSQQKQQLQRDVHALSTDVRALEAIARDELGLAYPGDRVMKLVPRNSAEGVAP